MGEPMLVSWEQSAPGPFTKEHKSQDSDAESYFTGAERPASAGCDRIPKQRALFLGEQSAQVAFARNVCPRNRQSILP